MKPNAPPVISALLQHAAPAIVSLNGEGFLPPEAYYPAGPDVLGGRGFGFVLPTRTPGMVMKITLDGSEVFAVEAMRQVGQLPGLPRTQGQAMRVDWHGEPVWIYWREDAPPPSLEYFVDLLRKSVDRRFPHRELFAYRDEKRERWRQDRTRFEDELGVSDAKRIAAAHDCAMGIAARIANQVVDEGRDIEFVLADLKAVEPEARAMFQPMERKSFIGGWTNAPGYDDLPYPFNVALDVLGYEFHLRAIEHGPLAPLLAKSLLRLLKAGVILCDADAQNISAADHTHPVLYDLGFCLPLQAKWLPLWHRVGTVMDRWWKHDERYKPWDNWWKQTYR